MAKKKVTKADGPPPPKIPPKQPKKKSTWNLPTSIATFVGVAIVAHLVYVCMTGSEGGVDPARSTELRRQGMLRVDANRLVEGIALLDKSIEADPFNPSGYNNKAGVLRMLGRSTEALKVLEDGLEKSSKKYGKDDESLWILHQGFFYVYKDLKMNIKAIDSIKRATELHSSAALYNSWASLDSVVSEAEQIELYDKALSLDPDSMSAFCSRYHTYSLIGDWDKLDRDHDLAEKYMIQASKFTKRTDPACMQPYQISYLNFTADMMRDTAKFYALREARVSDEEMLPPLTPSQFTSQFDEDGIRARKLRVGYVSSDLRNHPVGRNVVGLLMAHNKKKYDIYCFVTRHDEGDPITALVQQHCTYVDLTKLKKSHYEIAKMIREEYKIDVLIDLNGWTSGRLLEVFSAQPAPVQITHGLGFVGTSGVDAFQYFISDAVASPGRFDKMYTENVIRLPYAYLPTAHKTVQITPEGEKFDPNTTDKMALRKQWNLPEDEDIFVFCNFQSLHKISRESFDSTLRILKNSPQSVLWMIMKGQKKDVLLRHALKYHDLGPERFIFGEAQNAGIHMSRAQACDLHLDSWPYNAHSTAADVLWAGVPLLVYLPDFHDSRSPVQVPKMCSRVSASLVSSLNMPQLIKSSIEEFEDEAVRLSHDPQAYHALRKELLEKRLTSNIFDLVKYARVHEMAYSEVFERWFRGERATAMNVPPLSAF